MFEFIQELPQRLEYLEKQSKKVDEIEQDLRLKNYQFKFLWSFVSVILFVCILTFILVSLDYFKFATERQKHFYEKLEQKDKDINALNSRLNILENKFQSSRDTIH